MIEAGTQAAGPLTVYQFQHSDMGFLVYKQTWEQLITIIL